MTNQANFLSKNITAIFAFIPMMALAQGSTQFIANGFESSLSADGQVVVFESGNELVPSDTNVFRDVYVFDRPTQTFSRASVADKSLGGGQANTNSGGPEISANSRYVAFNSGASNLVANDTNQCIQEGKTYNCNDVFVHDRFSGSTEIISVASDGSHGNGDSFMAKFSADGRYVAFVSSASNLVANDSNGLDDVFVHDRKTGKTRRISIAGDGSQSNGGSGAPAISADGGTVAFMSTATNLATGAERCQGEFFSPCYKVFVHELASGKTSMVNLATDGTVANGGSQYPSISANGRYVAFSSLADNLVAGDTNLCENSFFEGESCEDVFVHDRLTGQTTLVSKSSQGELSGFNANSSAAKISADGRYVVFDSSADNFVKGDKYKCEEDAGSNRYSCWDVFVHDRYTAKTSMVSLADGGQKLKSHSALRGISADARHVLFYVYEDSDTPFLHTSRGLNIRDRWLDKTLIADFGVKIAAPQPATLGANTTFTITINNDGQNAGVATLLGQLSGDAQIQQVKPSQGHCDKAALTVCRLGKVAANATVTVSVTAKVTGKGPLRYKASVNAQPQDPKSRNNQATAVTVAKPL